MKQERRYWFWVAAIVVFAAVAIFSVLKIFSLAALSLIGELLTTVAVVSFVCGCVVALALALRRMMFSTERWPQRQ